MVITECLVHNVAMLSNSVWLGEPKDGGVERLGERISVVAGRNDDRHIRVPGSESCQRLGAVHDGHLEVE